MSALATLTTVERILTFAGPLITQLAGEDREEIVDRVLDGVSIAVEYGRMGIQGAEDFSAELQEIVEDLEAMKNSGGPQEADFDAAADRISDKTAALAAVVAERKASEG